MVVGAKDVGARLPWRVMSRGSGACNLGEWAAVGAKPRQGGAGLHPLKKHKIGSVLAPKKKKNRNKKKYT